MSFFEELKRRNVIRVAIAYVVGAWLLLQLTDVLIELLGLPGTAGKFIVLLLVVGYPADDAEVPDIKRKTLDEFASFVDT